MLMKLVLVYFSGLFFICSCFTEKIIIDTDAGGDDALAILLLLRAESLRKLSAKQYEIVGITCTYGNTKEENVETNVLKILTFTNRSDIPVYGGSKRPLIGNFVTDDHYGKDGFGDVEFDMEITAHVDKSKHASTALIELTKKHEGNISIVLLGPTTNLGLAISLDQNFTKRVKNFYVMGSSVAGVGNIRPNVEFNFAADPESNFILLNSTTSSQLSLLSWDTGLNTKITKDWRINVLGKLNSTYIEFMNAIEKYSLNRKRNFYNPTDAMTTAIMLWPEIITSYLDTNVQAVYDGAARGSVLVDYKQSDTRPFNARIIQTIDVKKFKELLVYYMTCETVECE